LDSNFNSYFINNYLTKNLSAVKSKLGITNLPAGPKGDKGDKGEKGDPGPMTYIAMPTNATIPIASTAAAPQAP
jgi:hypothetical protein